MNENGILLIEDNEDDIELTRRAMEKAGISEKIRIIRSGEEALDFIFRRGAYAGQEVSRPKLVLLDLHLPRMSGLKVLSQMSLDESTRSIPVVVLTVSRQEPDLMQSFTMGVRDYVIKPLEPVRIQELYRKYVEGTGG